MNNTIYDFIKCPHCGNDNAYITGTDEIEFEYNTGHYYFDCTCDECKKPFRTYIEFEYKVTKGWVR